MSEFILILEEQKLVDLVYEFRFIIRNNILRNFLLLMINHLKIPILSKDIVRIISTIKMIETGKKK